MLNILLFILKIIGALAVTSLAVVRLVESIYQLRKYPEMDTLQEIIQVVKNFFTIEKYEGPNNTTGTATTGE